MHRYLLWMASQRPAKDSPEACGVGCLVGGDDGGSLIGARTGCLVGRLVRVLGAEIAGRTIFSYPFDAPNSLTPRLSWALYEYTEEEVPSEFTEGKGTVLVPDFWMIAKD
jgi:predicted alpha/beta-hydrolase family hydrolase